MHVVISPAKSLDFERPLPGVAVSQPQFLKEAAELATVMKRQDPNDLARLGDLSPDLAALNAGRWQAWRTPHRQPHARPAVYAYNGDVYEGLDAWSLRGETIAFAQSHLLILSGLYGLLKPLDLIQPHRLEMGTRLATPQGKDLYAFWGTRLAQAVDKAVGKGVLVNLASEEYFKVLRQGGLKARVVTPVFEDLKGGTFKVVSFYAKRARGLMTRFILERRITNPEGLVDFAEESYTFDPEASRPERPVFRR